MDYQLGINLNFVFAGVSNGNVAFGKSFDSLGIYTHVAIQYVNYGDISSNSSIIKCSVPQGSILEFLD